MKKSRLQTCMVALVMTIFFAGSTYTVEGMGGPGGFSQGTGYEQGAYAVGGIPTWNNWDRQSEYKGPLEKPIKKWAVELTGVHNEDGIAVAPDGTSYVTSWDGATYTGYLYSVSPSGTLNWKKTYVDGWCPIIPTIGTDGMLYTASYYKYGEILPGSDNKEYDGRLEKLNSLDGNALWTYGQIPGKILNQPVMDGEGTVYFVTHNNSMPSWDKNDLFAIKNDGTLKWQGLLSKSNYACLVLGEKGLLYTVTGDNTNVRPYKLVAVDKTNGSVKASFMPADGGTLGAYVLIGRDGTLYVSASSYYKVYALDPITLKEKRSGDGFSFSAYAQASDGLLWSQGGTARAEKLVGGDKALGMNINTLSKNGYFGYFTAWGKAELRGKYPDLTDAWVMSGADLDNNAVYCAVVPRDGWIYTIERQVSTSRLVGYYGSTEGSNVLRAVNLSISPENSAPAGTSVKLTGKASGGSDVVYKFTVARGDQIGNYGAESVLRDYGSAICQWKPTAGSYKLFVYGRSKNGTDEKKSTENYFYVTAPQKYSAYLTASPFENVKVKKTVTLKAKAKGFKNPEYRFVYWSMSAKKDIVISNWGKKSSTYWKPTESGELSVRVEIREKGRASERIEAFCMVRVTP